MAADVSPAPIPNASLITGMVRGRMEATPDKQITLDMGKGDSWAKDVRNGNQGVLLDDIPKLLCILRLKIVEGSRICITPAERDEYEAYKTIAKAHLTPAPKLEQDW